MPALWKETGTLHPTFEKLNRCLEEDWFLLPHELRLQRASAKALTALGVLNDAEHASLLEALQKLERKYVGVACPASAAEDLHTWVEEHLTDLAGPAGRKIHTARSRNDQVATLLLMYVIAQGVALGSRLHRLIEIACQRAEDWANLAMPLHTHTQFAAPGSVGAWVLRFAAAFHRVRLRLVASLALWRRSCPLGSGAVAGSSIPLDRELLAMELGFAGPSFSALDSTSSRDECLEFLALAAQIGLHLQSMATDVVGFAQTPLGWVKYPPEFGTGSSMMPNKLNPDAMELLRGEACALAAALGQAILLLKGLPSGYNRDLQCIKPLVRQTSERLLTLCDMTAAFLEKLEFEPKRLEASLSQGAIGATLRMEEKVLAGKPLREAHHAIAEEVQKGSPMAAAIEDIARYKTIGSASPAEVHRVASMLRKAGHE